MVKHESQIATGCRTPWTLAEGLKTAMQLHAELQPAYMQLRINAEERRALRNDSWNKDTKTGNKGRGCCNRGLQEV